MCVCIHVRIYSIYKKECNKRSAAALENMAACAPLFSHQKHCTLMSVCYAPIAAPFAVKMQHVRRIAARLANSATILYPGTSPTNHKSAVQFLIKKWRTNFTNCCILFDMYCMCLRFIQGGEKIYYFFIFFFWGLLVGSGETPLCIAVPNLSPPQTQKSSFINHCLSSVYSNSLDNYCYETSI